MNILKQSEMLKILKSHIELALPTKEGLLIKIEWVEDNPEIIKELKEWLLNDK